MVRISAGGKGKTQYDRVWGEGVQGGRTKLFLLSIREKMFKNHSTIWKYNLCNTAKINETCGDLLSKCWLCILKLLEGSFLLRHPFFFPSRQKTKNRGGGEGKKIHSQDCNFSPLIVLANFLLFCYFSFVPSGTTKFLLETGLNQPLPPQSPVLWANFWLWSWTFAILVSSFPSPLPTPRSPALHAQSRSGEDELCIMSMPKRGVGHAAYFSMCAKRSQSTWSPARKGARCILDSWGKAKIGSGWSAVE